MRFLISLFLAFTVHNVATATCLPVGVTRSDLLNLEASKGEVADNAKRQSLAIGLVKCLADPDPTLRETASDALESWIQGEKLGVATLQTLRISQVAILKQNDPDGFATAFAALLLAELVKVDSVRPFLSDSDLGEIVRVGTTYLRGLRDYRGYDQKEGWRHAVPHASDLMMQLARHRAVGKKDQQLILEAVATQLYAAGSQSPPQFYHFSEGSRMARAVYYVTQRSDITTAEWDAWFGAFFITPEDRMASKPELFARRHNLKSFLMPLYILVAESKDAGKRETVLPYVAKALKNFERVLQPI